MKIVSIEVLPALDWLMTGPCDLIRTGVDFKGGMTGALRITVVPRPLAAEAAALALAPATTESSARADQLAGGFLRDVWERDRVL